MPSTFDEESLGEPMPLKVLVCDDERHIVRLIQVNLERQGYNVVTAFDGKEGLEKIRSERPNLVVLDVMMPYMDGFEVLKTIRREPETENLPVIMLTAKAQDKDVFEGYHYGADMYLTKPFNPMELVTFVKRIAQGTDDPSSGSKRYEI
jgi:two-component system alkaline phosphatase synthesis response regulator PhoP/two-component system response regulator VicR